ncbi:hypothetical protein BD779DRAFT_1521698 [Infundibulicybe gibba]|nr:hypothetical protein BD779DRAFT_1521698 [Infundibulicybe gibba]
MRFYIQETEPCHTENTPRKFILTVHTTPTSLVPSFNNSPPNNPQCLGIHTPTPIHHSKSPDCPYLMVPAKNRTSGWSTASISLQTCPIHCSKHEEPRKCTKSSSSCTFDKGFNVDWRRLGPRQADAEMTLCPDQVAGMPTCVDLLSYRLISQMNLDGPPELRTAHRPKDYIQCLQRTAGRYRHG